MSPDRPADDATTLVDVAQAGAELRAAALAYASRGWHVLPLIPGGKRPAFPAHPAHRCRGTDPRCAAAGRHVGWQERATTDPDRITRAWSSPTRRGGGRGDGAWFGVGIACGPSGLWVVDLDVAKPAALASAGARSTDRLTERLDQWGVPLRRADGSPAGGTEVLAAMAARAGERWPATYTVMTPSGGRHLYFTRPDHDNGRASQAGDGAAWGNTAGSAAPLIDTRAAGGLVAAPPTRTPAGLYRVASPSDVVVADAPAWLVDALRPASRPAPAAVTVAVRHATGVGEGPCPEPGRPDGTYLAAALRGEWDRVRAVHGPDVAPGRGRNHTLFVAAVALGQLVAGGGLTEARARAVLLDAAAPHLAVCTDCDRSAPATVTGGLARGATRPRYLPDPTRRRSPRSTHRTTRTEETR